MYHKLISGNTTIESYQGLSVYMIDHADFLMDNLRTIAQSLIKLFQPHLKVLRNIDKLIEKYKDNKDNEDIVDMLPVLVNCGILLQIMGKICEDVRGKDDLVLNMCEKFKETFIDSVKGMENEKR